MNTRSTMQCIIYKHTTYTNLCDDGDDNGDYDPLRNHQAVMVLMCACMQRSMTSSCASGGLQPHQSLPAIAQATTHMQFYMRCVSIQRISLQWALGGWVVVSRIASCVELGRDVRTHADQIILPFGILPWHVLPWPIQHNTSTVMSKNMLRYGMAIFREALV